MTEDEAKTTMCPKLSGNLAVKDSYGDMLVEFYRVDCSASECMWWVWDEYEDVGDKMVPSLPIGGHCGAIKCP